MRRRCSRPGNVRAAAARTPSSRRRWVKAGSDGHTGRPGSSGAQWQWPVLAGGGCHAAGGGWPARPGGDGVMSGPVVIDVRRGHWWEAPGLGLRSARAQEATARRGDRRAPADREPRLPRRRAVLPPPPLRFYVLVLICVVNLLVVPLLGRSDRGRHRRSRPAGAQGRAPAPNMGQGGSRRVPPWSVVVLVAAAVLAAAVMTYG